MGETALTLESSWQEERQESYKKYRLTRSLAGWHPLVVEERDTASGFHISLRQYPTGDVEATAIKMHYYDTLKRRGGAKRKNSEKKEMNESTLKKSQQRAKAQVRRKILSMQADRLLTLTFRENVTDIDEAWKILKYFIKLMRWRFKDFQYVVVPEYQKRGAVHFHLAVRGYYHANTVRRLWHRAAGEHGGNVDITSPRKYISKNSWNPRRIGAYLSKYMNKEETVDFNKKRYTSGGKVKIPESIKGWMALGYPVHNVMRDIINQMTDKSIRTLWEIDNFSNVVYLST